MTDLTTTQMAGGLLDGSCDNTAPSWNSCRSGPSDNHHDLPELTALLEIAVRIRHLVEGEGTVYDGFERAGLQALGDELDRGFAAGFITTREPDVVRLDGRHLGDHLQHGQRGDARAEQAVDVDDATEGQRRDEFGETRAADRIESDAHALAISDPHHLPDQADFFRGEDMHCADVAELLLLRRGAGQCDGRCARVVDDRDPAPP